MCRVTHRVWRGEMHPLMHQSSQKKPYKIYLTCQKKLWSNLFCLRHTPLMQHITVQKKILENLCELPKIILIKFLPPQRGMPDAAHYSPKKHLTKFMWVTENNSDQIFSALKGYAWGGTLQSKKKSYKIYLSC